MREMRCMRLAGVVRGAARISLLVCLCLGLAGALLAAKPSGEFRSGDWPFAPPQRPDVPVVDNAAWVTNSVDAFVLAALEAEGLAPNEPADKLTLLRRVTFDLAGLPPTPQEQADFLADDSPQAYERVVERLLASPRYGERWAQHWLDLVRYAETDGFKSDDYRPHAHKYRDYVIQAFNDDLPYDRFILQQLAGDELEPENPRALVATGLNRLYPDEYNAANLEQRRQEILDDVTSTTGLVFMGLTMGCAECHDHKFDDILQTDYYRLQAFFAPMLPRDDAVAATPAEKESHDEQFAVWREATHDIRAEIDAMLADARQKESDYALTKFRQEIQDAVHKPEAERTPYEQQIATMALKQARAKEVEAVKKLSDEQKSRYEELKQQLAEFDSLRPAPLPKATAIGDVGPTAPPTYVLSIGNWQKPRDEVQPGFPHFLGGPSADVLENSEAADSTGRRSALARWLARGDNPLTARVMVNRIWQHHFGVGIVSSPNDFGVMGDPASHPELLDWLAVEFIESGWSMKHMHRLLVHSAAYRQSSAVDHDRPSQARAAEVDPNNRLLWHARRRRLEGEAIRDAMLAVSGELNLRMYGESERPELPDGVSKSYAWQEDSTDADRHRRSIYVFLKRNLRYPLFDAFDLPDLHHSCAVRSRTTTAPQALLLLNSEFSLGRAQRFAERITAEHPTGDADLVRRAYLLAWGRPATEEEVALSLQFLAAQSAAQPSEASSGESASADASREDLSAVADFCHAMLNANEFLFID